MTDLCNEAHVDISSFYRWRRKGNPTVRKFKPAIGRLEACLIARERDVLSELLARYPDLATASPAPLVPA
jgi:hypothetical protein